MPMRKARADEADVSTECGIPVAPVYGPADVPSFADAIGELVSRMRELTGLACA
jgi:hypothetical protein